MSRLRKILSLFIAIVMISTLIPTLTLADTAEVVYLTVANTTFPASSGASWEGKILDNVEVEITDGMKVMDVITEALEENGFSKHQELDNDSIRSATYYKDNSVVHIYYLKGTNEFRVITQNDD